MNVRKTLTLGLVGLLWVPLLGLVVFSFDQSRMENQLCGWVALGLLPLIVLILSRWSTRTQWEEVAVPLVALAGLLVVVGFICFDIPVPRSILFMHPHAADRSELDESDRVLGKYSPTPQEVVERMLSLANVTEEDVVYDLGCGDGRIVVTAAKKYGARGVGIDIDPQRVKVSRENVEKAGVKDLVEIRQQDAMKVKDLDRATVVALFVLQEAAIQLRPILQKELKPGSRIVSHRYDLGDWEPHRMTQLYLAGQKHLIYMWRIGRTKEQRSEDQQVPQPAD